MQTGPRRNDRVPLVSGAVDEAPPTHSLLAPLALAHADRRPGGASTHRRRVARRGMDGPGKPCLLVADGRARVRDGGLYGVACRPPAGERFFLGVDAQGVRVLRRPRRRSAPRPGCGDAAGGVDAARRPRWRAHGARRRAGELAPGARSLLPLRCGHRGDVRGARPPVSRRRVGALSAHAILR